MGKEDQARGMTGCFFISKITLHKKGLERGWNRSPGAMAHAGFHLQKVL